MKQLMILVTIIITLQSCGPFMFGTNAPVSVERQNEHRYYSVSAPNSQLLENKKDLGFSIKQNVIESATQLSGGYIVTDGFGIVASIGLGAPQHGSIQNTEVGIGYIKSLKNNTHFEIYGGGGFGNYFNSHVTGYSNLSYSSFFIQPAYVVHNKKDRIRMIVASRFSGLNYNSVEKYFDINNETRSNELISVFQNQKLHLFWEPAASLHYGWKNFNFNTQILQGIHLSKGKVVTGNPSFSIGASIRFNLKNK